MTLGRSSKHGPVVPGLEKSVSVALFFASIFFFFFQFNYMHECFERVFCELKWRKEVILDNLELIFFIFKIFVCLKCIVLWSNTWGPHLHLSRNVS